MLLEKGKDSYDRKKFLHFSEEIAGIYCVNCLHHRIINHNYRSVYGELDLITQDADNLWHAIEVKWVKQSIYDPKWKMSAAKRERMEKVILHFFSTVASACPLAKKRIGITGSSLPAYTLDLIVFQINVNNSVHLQYFPDIML